MATEAASSPMLLRSTSASASLRTGRPTAGKVCCCGILLISFLVSLNMLSPLRWTSDSDLFSPASAASPCRPNPCQNGGSCKKGPKRSSFQCSCPSGYSGKFCEVGKYNYVIVRNRNSRCYMSTVKVSRRPIHREMHPACVQTLSSNEPSGLL